MPWEQLLEQCLKNPRIDRLLEENRITPESAQSLSAIQDLVYVSDNNGRLHEMFPGTIVKQAGRVLEAGAETEVVIGQAGEIDVAVIDLEVDRWNVGYGRNWIGFNARKWAKNEASYLGFIRSALEQDRRPSEADSILELDSAEARRVVLRTLAKRVWEADFESYSRFTGQKLIFKTGDETVQNIIEGGGGICSEKVQALKFLTDNLGYESEYLLAGPNARKPVPEERLRELLTTFEFGFSKRFMRYWQHMALLYHLDGVDIIVDATNGNIPFLFLEGPEAEGMLNCREKVPVSVRMSLHEESFYYHRVSQDIPENLLFALEGWIPEADLIQVIENELGLIITEGFYVTPLLYKSRREFLDLERQYKGACESVGLPCVVDEEWSLDSEIGREFAGQHPLASGRVMASRQHLLSRYNASEGLEHEAGMVIVGLGR
ncbi:MAG: hypothetical protein BZY87_10585 [SAR202 cluster bacterium Io17-Chloro-G6]|nr:MAG: hypothetical protein BZY87_10585 [SAR202 cluster bacterium Io17-Chloro-G6]